MDGVYKIYKSIRAKNLSRIIKETKTSMDDEEKKNKKTSITSLH